jgi:hypothetical protein
MTNRSFPGIGKTQGVKAPKRARNFDWDPIRGLHHGQQAKRLHSKAVDMTANDRSAEPILPLRDRDHTHCTAQRKSVCQPMGIRSLFD